jgi:hypothetical protein
LVAALDGFFRLSHDDDYVYLVAAAAHRFAVRALMLRDAQKSVYGLPVADSWNEQWEFVVDKENIKGHPKGLGDCSSVWSRLCTLVSPKAQLVLVPLLKGKVELLPATHAGRRILVVNVINRVARENLHDVGPDDVFRVAPVGLDVFVGENVRKTVAAAGLTGIRFMPFDPQARVPVI